MKRVFISYAREDVLLAQEIFLHLEEEHLAKAWIDVAGLRPAQDWRVQIREALDNADVVICLASSFSMRSENVAEECAYARTAGKPVAYWIIDNGGAADPVIGTASLVVDLRSDPLDARSWDSALEREFVDPTKTQCDSVKETLPPYVREYLESWRRLLRIGGFLGALSIAAMLWPHFVAGPQTFDDEPFYLYFAILLVVWGVELSYHLWAIRRRRAHWRELALYWRITIALFVLLGGPVFGSASALAAIGLGGIGIILAIGLIVVGCVAVLRRGVQLNRLWATHLLGGEDYRPRSDLVAQDLARSTVTRRDVRELVARAKIIFWCPAFSRRNWLAVRARRGPSSSRFEGLGPEDGRFTPTNLGVLICANADFPLGIAIASRVGISAEPCAKDHDWGATGDRIRDNEEAAVFLLTRRSVELMEAVLRELSLERVVIVSVGESSSHPAIRDAQIIDGTTLDLEWVASRLAAARGKSMPFAGFRDTRALAMKAPVEVLGFVGMVVFFVVANWGIVMNWGENVAGSALIPSLSAGVTGAACAAALGLLRRAQSLVWLELCIGLSSVVTTAALVTVRTDVEIMEWLFPTLFGAFLLLRTREERKSSGGATGAWAPATASLGGIIAFLLAALGAAGMAVQFS